MSIPRAERAHDVGDRVEALTEEQRQRVLWRAITRDPDLIDSIINELEAAGWEWGR